MDSAALLGKLQSAIKGDALSPELVAQFKQVRCQRQFGQPPRETAVLMSVAFSLRSSKSPRCTCNPSSASQSCGASRALKSKGNTSSKTVPGMLAVKLVPVLQCSLVLDYPALSQLPLLLSSPAAYLVR